MVHLIKPYNTWNLRTYFPQRYFDYLNSECYIGHASKKTYTEKLTPAKLCDLKNSWFPPNSALLSWQWCMNTSGHPRSYPIRLNIFSYLIGIFLYGHSVFAPGWFIGWSILRVPAWLITHLVVLFVWESQLDLRHGLFQDYSISEIYHLPFFWFCGN